jgi:mitochondrial chaperone BCS1
MLNADRQKLWIQNKASKLGGVMSTLETQLADFRASMSSQESRPTQDFVYNVKSFQMQVESTQTLISDNITMANEILQKIGKLSSARRSADDIKLERDVDEAGKQLQGFQERLDKIKAADALPLLLKMVSEFEDSLALSGWWSILTHKLRRRFIPFFIDGYVRVMQKLYPHIRFSTDEEQQPLQPDYLGGGRRGMQTMQKNLYLRVWGRNLSVLLRVVEDAMKWEFDKRPDQKVQIFTWDNGHHRDQGWSPSCTRDARSKSSVFFDGALMEELIADARHFYSPKTIAEVYHAKGKPHRRGYLLYGAPGCGKTSFISVLAGEIDKNICMVALKDPEMDDQTFTQCLRDAPNGALICLEDVDALFSVEGGQSANTRAMSKNSKLSFSGILNALDGVASHEGHIVIMTTNHRERLDKALIRKGRIDLEVEVKPASKDQMEKMFTFFYNDSEDVNHLARKFSASLPQHQISMAALQVCKLFRSG